MTVARTITIILFWIAGLSIAAAAPPAAPWSTATAVTNQSILPVEQAFALHVSADSKNIEVGFQVGDNCCYLYEHTVKITSLNPGVELAAFNFPPGEAKQDEVMGDFIAHTDDLFLIVPRSETAAPLTVAIDYQGCAKSGFCYPPMTRYFEITGNEVAEVPEPPTTVSFNTTDTAFSSTQVTTISLWALIKYFGIGLLLAFTPCILPMLPILSGILLGQQDCSRRKAFGLSATYVIAMSLTYAVAGILAARLGYGLQGAMQTPLIIISFVAILLLMALWLFEKINLNFLNQLYEKIEPLSRSRQGGAYTSAFFMGIIATLVASPCVTAPLIGILSYITQSGNMLYGGLALFCLGLGLGTPLMLIAVFGQQILPKRGPWMQIVSRGFGVALVALSIDLLDRIVPGQYTVLMWGFWGLWVSYLLGVTRNSAHWLLARLSVVFLLLGSLWLVGALMAKDEPFFFIKAFHSQAIGTPHPFHPFETVETLTSLTHVLEHAKENAQPVMIDFYADWCIACQHLHYTIEQPSMQAALTDWQLVRVDITDMSYDIKAVMQQYGVIAPPALIFYDAQGNYLPQATLVGEPSIDNLVMHLKKVHSQ